MAKEDFIEYKEAKKGCNPTITKINRKNQEYLQIFGYFKGQKIGSQQLGKLKKKKLKRKKKKKLHLNPKLKLLTYIN